MKLTNKRKATGGLIFISFLSVINSIYYRTFPDNVSLFGFLCITNLIAFILFTPLRFKQIIKIEKSALKKGALLGLEITGYFFFLMLAAKNTGYISTSGVVSLYFVFITPALIILKRRINLYSSIATITSIIAILLMAGPEMDSLIGTDSLFYLIAAAFCFAMYVISVWLFGKKETTTDLTYAQIVFSVLFSLVGWGIEVLTVRGSMSLPKDPLFWVTALICGILMRIVYPAIHITSQRHLMILKSSLIFSSQIIIALLIEPFLCAAWGIDYNYISFFQIMGMILFIISILMTDYTAMDWFLKKFMGKSLTEQEKEDGPVEGDEKQTSTVARKMIFNTLSFSIIILASCAVIFISTIMVIRRSAIQNSEKLGSEAAETSMEAMIEELEDNIQTKTVDKTLLAQQKLEVYSDTTLYMSNFGEALLAYPDSYPAVPVDAPDPKNDGKWTMQRLMAQEGIYDENLQKECELLGNMEDVFAPISENIENVSAIYIGTRDGLLLPYDPNSKAGSKIDHYEFRKSAWYTLGKSLKRNEQAFTDVYQDVYGRGLTITTVAPIMDKDGNFFACVAMDILIESLNQSMVNDGIVDPSAATLITNTGQVIAGKNFDNNSETPGNIFDKGVEPKLKPVGKQILKEKNGILRAGEGSNAYYVAYATIDSTDWTLCIITPVSTLSKPALEIKNNIDEHTDTVVDSVVEAITGVIQSFLFLIALILLFVTFLTGKYSRRITDPLKQLESDVRQISGGNLDRRTEVDTNDEIGSLARSFNVMADSLQTYITDLTEATAREERINSELTVAADIQANMMPRDFGVYSDHREFNLFAFMTPAKEVGGDFYDFFMIDDIHLCLVMADVSGKGVPAALFMAKAKTSLKIRAMIGDSPSDILADVNDIMCEGNEEGLFVTVWFAIIDVTTGEGVAANAGHEHPALRRANDKFELIVYRHSPAVATMDGMIFRQHDFKLNPGDTLFVYTDGVAEATDANDELFGPDRLVEALNKKPDADPEIVITNVLESIAKFVGGEEQFDDITMLCIRYNGNKDE